MMRFITHYCFFFLVIISATHADTITEQIRADGKIINVERSLKRWQPLWDKADNTEVSVTKDIKYGPHNKQGFDLYEPKQNNNTPSPILIFLHGGSFVAGDKAMYSNVGYHFAKQGITAIIMTYRLAPDFKWPSGTLDLAAQIKWIRDNPGKFKNADTSNIFLFGHSAGAQHVASYIFEEEYQIQNDGVVGAILASGSVYDTSILKGDADPQYYDYFGYDPKKYPERSVLAKLDGRKIPVFVAYAEFDKQNFQYQAIKMINALYGRDNQIPMVKQVIDHNHLSEIFHFNTGYYLFSNDILNFMKSSLQKNN